MVTQNSYKRKSLGSSNDSLNWPLDLNTMCPIKYLPLYRGSRTEEIRGQVYRSKWTTSEQLVIHWLIRVPSFWEKFLPGRTGGSLRGQDVLDHPEAPPTGNPIHKPWTQLGNQDLGRGQTHGPRTVHKAGRANPTERRCPAGRAGVLAPSSDRPRARHWA